MIVGLALMGGGGFLLYKKIMADREADFAEEPQLDQAARDRIRTQPQVPVKPQPRPQNPQVPRPAVPVQQSQAAQPYAAQTAASVQHPQYAPQAERNAQQPQYAPQAGSPQQMQHVQQAAYAAEAASEPTQTFRTRTEPQNLYAEASADRNAAPQPDPGYQGAFSAHEAPKTYQGAFENHKPSMADKAVKSAHRSQQPEAHKEPEAPAPVPASDELDALKDWLDRIDE